MSIIDLWSFVIAPKYSAPLTLIASSSFPLSPFSLLQACGKIVNFYAPAASKSSFSGIRAAKLLASADHKGMSHSLLHYISNFYHLSHLLLQYICNGLLIAMFNTLVCVCIARYCDYHHSFYAHLPCFSFFCFSISIYCFSFSFQHTHRCGRYPVRVTRQCYEGAHL